MARIITVLVVLSLCLSCVTIEQRRVSKCLEEAAKTCGEPGSEACKMASHACINPSPTATPLTDD